MEKGDHFLKKYLSNVKKKHTFLGMQSSCLKKYVVSASSSLPVQMILLRYHRMTNGATGYIRLFFKEDKESSCTAAEYSGTIRESLTQIDYSAPFTVTGAKP